MHDTINNWFWFFLSGIVPIGWLVFPWIVILVQYLRIKKFKIPEDATYKRKQILEIKKDKNKNYIVRLHPQFPESYSNRWMIYVVVILPFVFTGVITYSIVQLFV